MSKAIRVGDTFTARVLGNANTYRREEDCEGALCVTHLTSSAIANMRAYTFLTEPQWFEERGLHAT